MTIYSLNGGPQSNLAQYVSGILYSIVGLLFIGIIIALKCYNSNDPKVQKLNRIIKLQLIAAVANLGTNLAFIVEKFSDKETGCWVLIVLEILELIGFFLMIFMLIKIRRKIMAVDVTDSKELYILGFILLTSDFVIEVLTVINQINIQLSTDGLPVFIFAILGGIPQIYLLWEEPREILEALRGDESEPRWNRIATAVFTIVYSVLIWTLASFTIKITDKNGD